MSLRLANGDKRFLNALHISLEGQPDLREQLRLMTQDRDLWRITAEDFQQQLRAAKASKEKRADWLAGALFVFALGVLVGLIVAGVLHG